MSYEQRASFRVTFLMLPADAQVAQADPETVELYKSVINNVIMSVEEKWRRNGGNPKTLEEIRAMWLHRALLRCGIQTPEPQRSNQMINRMQTKRIDPLSDELALLMGQAPAKPQESSSESNSDMTSGSDGDSEEESSGLGSDPDDPEVDYMVEMVPAKDHMFCHFRFPEDVKNEQRGKTYSFKVSCVHLTIDGVPHVVKGGEIVVTKPKV